MQHKIGCQQFYQNSSPELNVFTICMLHQIGCLQFYQESSPELYVCIICMLHQIGCLQFYQESSPELYVCIICMLHQIGCLQFYRILSISNMLLFLHQTENNRAQYPREQFYGKATSSTHCKQQHSLYKQATLAQANSTPQVCLRSLIGLIVVHY